MNKTIKSNVIYYITLIAFAILFLVGDQLEKSAIRSIIYLFSSICLISGYYISGVIKEKRDN